MPYIILPVLFCIIITYHAIKQHTKEDGQEHEYTFLYEDDFGDLADYKVTTTSMTQAKRIAKEKCPDAIDCCVDVLVDGKYK